MDLVSQNKCFEGMQQRYAHRSAVLNCDMHFSVFAPAAAVAGQKLPVLYWLSGLTCTDDNFSTKAGAQRYAAEHEIILIIPDTSPRGADVPDDSEGAYDLGLGAGFYVNATRAPWDRHYRMYDYIARELPELAESHLPFNGRRAISGHSMGGHGALIIAMREAGRYVSVSAFAPIVNPAGVPWGEKAFGAYLGDDRNAWAEYDACHLVAERKPELPILIDQGTADDFLAGQLLTERFVEAAGRAKVPATVNLREAYDHSYYFISSFIGDHLRFHAGHLNS
ncbi:MAG: S-formylglutathione hydrolase [bacterium]|nr:S-formylglutathione hydrolase [bacterium]